MMLRCVSLMLLILMPRIACGDDDKRPSDPPVATGRFVYKQEPRRTLTVYYPDDWKADDRRPTLIIFRCNIPYQREHFRKLGMVVIEPQLAAVNSGRPPSLSLEEITKQPKPRDQVADTKSAIRFIRSHADELGVDPNRSCCSKGQTALAVGQGPMKLMASFWTAAFKSCSQPIPKRRRFSTSTS